MPPPVLAIQRSTILHLPHSATRKRETEPRAERTGGSESVGYKAAMQNIGNSSAGFSVLENGSGLQTAVITLDPGEASGSYGNEHPESEQVLFVVHGSLEAEVGKKRFSMRAGDSTVVPRGAAHRFINRSAERAVTFNVYSPKAY